MGAEGTPPLPLRVAALAVRVYMKVDRTVRPVRTRTTLHGIKMKCDTRDFVPRRIAYFGVYEHELTDVVCETVEPGDVFLDIGANIGYFALLAGTRVAGEGRVVAIEADPSTYGRLIENVELNPSLNISARHVAVTATPCRVRMTVRDKKNLGASQIAEGGDGAEVEGQPLDIVVGEDLARATFIKIDVEGAEAPLLDVILQELPRMSPRLTIAVEVDESNQHYIARFEAKGFNARKLSNPYEIEYYLARAMKQKRTCRPATSIGDYVLVRNGAGQDAASPT